MFSYALLHSFQDFELCQIRHRAKQQSRKHTYYIYTQLHIKSLTHEIVILWRILLHMYVHIRTHNYTKPAIIPSVCKRWHFNYMKVSWGVLALRCECVSEWAPLSISTPLPTAWHDGKIHMLRRTGCVLYGDAYIYICAFHPESSWMLLSVKTASKFHVDVLGAHSHPRTFFSVHHRPRLRSQQTGATSAIQQI